MNTPGCLVNSLAFMVCYYKWNLFLGSAWWSRKSTYNLSRGGNAGWLVGEWGELPPLTFWNWELTKL